MIDVLCPLCNERVTGEEMVVLSLNLREHMRETHKLLNLYHVDNESTEGSSGPSSISTDRKEDISLLPRRDTWEEVSEMVRCPFCGDLICGGAEDDLSYNLAKHVNFNHSIKVKWMGKG